jgi:hypothetical protein
VPDREGVPPSSNWDLPQDLPSSAPAVIAVDIGHGGTLYRVFDSPAAAQVVWDDEVQIRKGERAFLFNQGVLVAFTSEI